MASHVAAEKVTISSSIRSLVTTFSSRIVRRLAGQKHVYKRIRLQYGCATTTTLPMSVFRTFGALKPPDVSNLSVGLIRPMDESQIGNPRAEY